MSGPVAPSSDRVPWRVVSIIYAITTTEGLAAEMLSPFIADMVKIRFGISEANSGVAIGMIIGAYYLAQFVSSILIGYLSDRMGRRIPLTIGLVSSALCTFIFALAPNYAFALAVRIVLGLTNSNIAVARAALCDAATGKARTLAMSFLSSLYQLSRAVATAVSGLLAGIVISKEVDFLNNPYLLVCSIGSVCVVVTLIASFWTFPDQYQKSTNTSSSNDDWGMLKGLKFILSDSLLRKLFYLHVVHSFCNGSVLMMLITYFALRIEDLGLGYTTFQIGMCFAALGLAGFLFQIIFFDKIISRYRLKTAYGIGATVSAISAVFVPFAGLFYQFGSPDSTMSVALTWVASLAVSSGTGIALMLGLSVLGPMLANATEQKMQGLTQGANQSFSSLLRAFGPMTSGLLFALAVNIRFPYIPFIVLGILYMINFGVSRTLTEDDMRRCEKTPTKLDTTPAPVVPISEESALELTPLPKRKEKNMAESKSILRSGGEEDEELDEIQGVDEEVGIVSLDEVPIAGVGDTVPLRDSPQLRVLRDH